MKRLKTTSAPVPPSPAPADVCADFEPIRLVQARQLLGWTRQDLADAAGVEPWRVTHWESAVSTPKAYQLVKVAEATGQLVAYFKRGRPMAIIDSAQVHICWAGR